MNQLILLVFFLLLFVWFGGNNVPKFLMDNKEILLGVAGGLVLCSFYRTKLEGLCGEDNKVCSDFVKNQLEDSYIISGLVDRAPECENSSNCPFHPPSPLNGKYVRHRFTNQELIDNCVPNGVPVYIHEDHIYHVQPWRDGDLVDIPALVYITGGTIYNLSENKGAFWALIMIRSVFVKKNGESESLGDYYYSTDESGISWSSGIFREIDHEISNFGCDEVAGGRETILRGLGSQGLDPGGRADAEVLHAKRLIMTQKPKDGIYQTSFKENDPRSYITPTAPNFKWELRINSRVKDNRGRPISYGDLEMGQFPREAKLSVGRGVRRGPEMPPISNPVVSVQLEDDCNIDGLSKKSTRYCSSNLRSGEDGPDSCSEECAEYFKPWWEICSFDNNFIEEINDLSKHVSFTNDDRHVDLYEDITTFVEKCNSGDSGDSDGQH